MDRTRGGFRTVPAAEIKDGLDFSVGLGELADGSLSFVIMVYLPANKAAGGVGFECQVSAMDEIASVEKTGGSFEVNK